MKIRQFLLFTFLTFFITSCGENYHLTLESESSPSLPSPPTQVDQISVTCSVSPETAGVFVAGVPSAGSIAIPISTTEDVEISVDINENGFTGSYSGTLTASDNSIVVPVSYDGSGSAGDNISFNLASDNFDNPCVGKAHLLTPLELAFGERASRYVEDGNNAVCGMQLDKDVYCWGRGAASVQTRGAGGNFTPVLQAMPGGVTPVAILPLEANGYAITSGGDVYSWGQYLRTGAHQSLGYLGVTGAYNAPAELIFPTAEKVRTLMGEHTEACTIMTNNDLYCWGNNLWGELGLGHASIQVTPIYVTSDVVDLVMGGSTHCIHKFDGKVYCSGNGTEGQLGSGVFVNSTTFQEVVGLTDVKTIHSVGQGGSDANCALKNDGTVWCWGENVHGQLGNGGGGNQNVPVQAVALGSDVKKLSAGYQHNCALKNDGTVWCWGRNNRGQVGDGTTNTAVTPVKVSTVAMEPVVDIGIGQEHTCALTSTNTVWCWGRNNRGQLGNSSGGQHNSPYEFGSDVGGGFVAVDEMKVYRNDTCVLSGANVYCVGSQSGTNLAGPKLDLNL